MLISISGFSQEIVEGRKCYDSDNNCYIKTKISNNTNKDIVCLVFYLRGDNEWDVTDCENVTVKVNIEAYTTKTITYYSYKEHFEPTRQYIKKVIFSDGSYKELF